MNVRARLLVGFGIAIFLLVVVGTVGIRTIGGLEAKVALVAEDRLAKTIWANEIIDEINTQGRILRNTLIYKDATHINNELARLPESRSKLADRLKKLEDNIHSPEGHRLLNAVEDKRNAYLVVLEQMIAAQQAGKISTSEASIEMLEKLRKVQAPYIADMVKLIDFQTELATHDAKSAIDDAHQARVIMMISLLVGVIASAIAATVITRSLASQLGGEPAEASNMAIQIANGNFTHRHEGDTGDADSMMSSLLRMQSTLGQTIAGLRNSVSQVDSSADAMARTASQSAQGAAQASLAASSMASAVEQVTVSIHHVGDNARAAMDIVSRASQLSEEGGEVIGNAVTEMHRIASSVHAVADSISNLGSQSDRISGIVQTIKDVADQTNLLALNAAIEAARAGETGRGFAVVADEVRKLAERTTLATGEISGMIAGIQHSAQDAGNIMRATLEQVGRGTELAEAAGSAIVSIRSTNGEVRNVVQEISVAITEQGVASSEIAQQVERVAQASEQNSAAASQSSYSAEQLRELARGMMNQMERFRV